MPPVINRGWGFIAVAGILFSFATWFAFTQAPRPDLPVAPGRAWISPDWWRYPVERNAMRRLPSISGGMKSIFSLSGGKHLWAVGDGGMIVYSQDGGMSWQQGHIVTAASAGQPPAAPPGGDQKQEKMLPKAAAFLGINEAVAGEPPAQQTGKSLASHWQGIKPFDRSQIAGKIINQGVEAVLGHMIFY